MNELLRLVAEAWPIAIGILFTALSAFGIIYTIHVAFDKEGNDEAENQKDKDAD